MRSTYVDSGGGGGGGQAGVIVGVLNSLYELAWEFQRWHGLDYRVGGWPGRWDGQIIEKCGVFWFSFWSACFFQITFFTAHIRKSIHYAFHLVGQYIVSSVHLKVIANWVHLFIVPPGRFVRYTRWNFRYQGTEKDYQIVLVKNITSKPLLEPSPWLPCMYACNL